MGNPDCLESWMGSRWVKVGSLLVGLGETPPVGLVGLGETPRVGSCKVGPEDTRVLNLSSAALFLPCCGPFTVSDLEQRQRRETRSDPIASMMKFIPSGCNLNPNAGIVVHSSSEIALMMRTPALLLFCCLVVSLSCSPLYPSLRFGQRDTSILLTSSIEDPLRLLEEAGAPSVELRSGRHADAVFTNSYRKVLGQIYARKFLQNIMGKRLRDGSMGYVKRHQLGI
ncbi:Somatoliberin [Merluccius polli]|uniref:Somatoliberin n=1 Tax=Merluccius polli TaxID=89951 RepID=A0AA47ND89_MERPO|nr:Somatoliberin [Merluccius polli]